MNKNLDIRLGLNARPMPGFVKTDNTLIFAGHFQHFLGSLEVNKSEIQLAKNSVHIQLIPTVASTSIAGIPLE
jgi:hypothetical protein